MTGNNLKNMKAQNLYVNNSELTNETSSTEAVNSGQLEITQRSLNAIENFNFNKRVKIAEIKLATFFVEKNVPFTIASELLMLMKDIGKESNVLHAMSLGRKKLTRIVNNVICQETNRISKVLRENKFSVYEDETSDVTSDK